MEISEEVILENKIRTMDKKAYIAQYQAHSNLDSLNQAIDKNEIDYVRKSHRIILVALTPKTLNHILPSMELIMMRKKGVRARDANYENLLLGKLKKPLYIEFVNYRFSKKLLEDNPKCMFIFEDNYYRTDSPNSKEENVDKDSWYYQDYKDRTPKPIHKGYKKNKLSSRVRGLCNAFPLTVRKSHNERFSTTEIKLMKQLLNEDIKRITSKLLHYHCIVICNKKFGAEVYQTKSLQSVIDEFLVRLGIDNTGPKPEIIINKQIGMRIIKKSSLNKIKLEE